MRESEATPRPDKKRAPPYPPEGGRSVIPPRRVGARLHLRKALGQAWEGAGRGIGFQLRGNRVDAIERCGKETERWSARTNG